MEFEPHYSTDVTRGHCGVYGATITGADITPTASAFYGPSGNHAVTFTMMGIGCGDRVEFVRVRFDDLSVARAALRRLSLAIDAAMQGRPYLSDMPEPEHIDEAIQSVNFVDERSE